MVYQMPILLPWLVLVGLMAASALPLAKESENVTWSGQPNVVVIKPVPGLYQGDIKLQLTKSGLYSIGRWPNRIVPYKFEGSFATEPGRQDRIHLAMTQISDVTCIRFEPAQATTKTFVAFTDAEDGCWAEMGYTGYRQLVNLGPNCQTTPTAIHELLHTLGIGHEQSRPDRDKYIRFRDDETKNSYGIDNEFAIAGFPYDWGSISHYSVSDINPEMIPRAPGVKYIGSGLNQNLIYSLSLIDAAKINALYGCDCPQ